jgi:hypothetical protein
LLKMTSIATLNNTNLFMDYLLYFEYLKFFNTNRKIRESNLLILA